MCQSYERRQTGPFLLRHSVAITVKDSGLGVRRVASLALPVFFASAASNSPSRLIINLSGSVCSDNKYLQSYLSAWSTAFGTVSETLPCKQPFWDRPGVPADRAVVEATLVFQRASFLTASKPL